MSLAYGVVTISLNSASTIRRTIESVLIQNTLPKEYVLVDGGSSDSTLGVIEDAISKARERFPIRFEIVHQTSQGGIPEAWNMGLRALKSNIAFILNSDDWYEPDTATRVMACFEENPDAEIVLGSGRYFRSEQDTSPFVCRNRDFRVLPFATAVIHPACFVRRAVYERVGYYDERYRVSADYEFVYRCYKSAAKFVRFNAVLVNVQTGGFSERHKVLARKETVEIGERYSSWRVLPRLAWLARMMFNR